MNEQLQHRVQAWVDGELTEAEAGKVAEQVRLDPAVRALAENLRSFATVLREGEPVRPVPESRDFYWSRIREGIQRAERAADRPEARSAPSPVRWLAWLLPLGAAALAMIFFVRSPEAYGPGGTIGSEPSLVGHVVETPSDEVTSLTFYSAQDSMTVVWLGKIDFL